MSASDADILEALAFVAATFPGKLPEATRRAWLMVLRDLGFERVDLAEACRTLVAEHAELAAVDPEGARYWRLDLGPLVAAARKARGVRVQQRAQKLDRPSLPAPGRSHRDPMRVRATRLTIAWVARCVSERRAPDEMAIQARTNAAHSVLLQAKQLGVSLEDDDVEPALAAEAIGKTLRRLVGDLAPGR